MIGKWTASELRKKGHKATASMSVKEVNRMLNNDNAAVRVKSYCPCRFECECTENHYDIYFPGES